MHICLQKYTFHVNFTTFSLENLLFGKYFLDFLVGFSQFVLAEFDEFLRTFQLIGHLVDVEFVVCFECKDTKKWRIEN